jgi:anti-sigma B factor antagonist
MSGRLTDEPLTFCLHACALGSEVVLTAAGEVDIASVPAVAAVFAETVTSTCRRVVIDAGGITFLDAAGLRALLNVPQGRGHDVDIVLRRPSRPVRRVLELVGMTSVVEPCTPGPDTREADRMTVAAVGPASQER